MCLSVGRNCLFEYIWGWGCVCVCMHERVRVRAWLLEFPSITFHITQLTSRVSQLTWSCCSTRWPTGAGDPSCLHLSKQWILGKLQCPPNICMGSGNPISGPHAATLNHEPTPQPHMVNFFLSCIINSSKCLENTLYLFLWLWSTMSLNIPELQPRCFLKTPSIPFSTF